MAQVDSVLGDAKPDVGTMRQLRYTTRVINEAMRLYPQPPVLIRRALVPDTLGGYPIAQGQDLFISVWNLHRSPALWDEPEAFRPDRFGPLDGSVPNEVRHDRAQAQVRVCCACRRSWTSVVWCTQVSHVVGCMASCC